MSLLKLGAYLKLRRPPKNWAPKRPHEKCKGTQEASDVIAINLSYEEKGEILEGSLVTLVGEIKEQLTNKEPDVPLIARYPYLAIMWQRYQVSMPRAERIELLNEVCSVTGLNRSYANRLLKQPTSPCRKVSKKNKKPKYLLIVPVVKRLWKLLNRCGGKKLHAAIPEWTGFLETTFEQRSLLMKVSAAEIDRILKPIRAEHRRKHSTGTRPSTHRLKSEVPIKPLGKTPTKPGFMEIDTVAHCGDSMSGQFFWTLTAVDTLTRWTCIKPVWTKESERIKSALEEMESELPFKLLGLYMDCGSEFLNEEVMTNYALDKSRGRLLEVGRSRPYKKNDQCFVEQKNNTHVRQLLGYGRFGYSKLESQFKCLFEDWNQLQNFFVPQVHLVSKERIGSKIKRRYSKPLTAFERVLSCEDVSLADKGRLLEEKSTLNPVLLSNRIREKLRKIYLIQETHKNLQGRMAS